MTEGMPPTPEQQMRQLNRRLTEKMLDKAASDPLWKEQLLDDPSAAMLEANFPELERLEELLQRQAALQEAEEVSGQVRPQFTNAYPCCLVITRMY
jgi:hypothetical protein